ncbi:hypothetical protein QBC34DRAFT_404346 [Podospora aff. communis PSN243]|uniref:Cyclin-D1-binding protein 1-like N-terminal domain-containing protein n=1 Tax=Podospora aff. communis PSN243 TaxID=3040156 RepID=A0AAV9GNM2_9PEZI|nr:hypothetical protein QBC34DRAFT_404346 [Podospora aff. communis PSN243]
MATPSASALATLEAVVNSALTLIAQLETTIKTPPPTSSTPTTDKTVDKTTPDKPLDPLLLAHDAATLIKAHSTKISLLIINAPFTPSAITTVLRELLTQPLPALASAVQLCTPARYTHTISADLSWRCGRVLKELAELVSRIPKDGKILTDAKKNAGVGGAGEKGSIAATAVLWAACDDVVGFAKKGFAGNLVGKVEGWRDTLKDVMEELREWGEEEVDEEDEDEEDDDGVEEVTQGVEKATLEGTDSTQAMLDEWMSSQRHIPRDDPDKIRERLESCLRKLRLTTLLYQATVKRRLKILGQQPPEDSTVPGRLDEVMTLLKRIPDRFSNVALAFYELDPVDIDRLMDQCFFDAFALSELLFLRWDGQKDEFSDWALKFQVEIKKA